MQEYMKEDLYSEQLRDFFEKMALIAEQGGYKLEDMKARFDSLLFDL